MYEVNLFIGKSPICCVFLKSITQVAKFLDTVDFEMVNVHIYTPKMQYLDPKKVIEVWHA